MHWGIVVGIAACLAAYVLVFHTVPGFSMRVAGGNVRAARMVGLSVAGMTVAVCFAGGAAAGLAGMIEVAAINGKANSSLIAGYGFTGILISFIARHNPLVIIPGAILLGGIAASGGLIQRRLGLPDAAVLVLQGHHLPVRADRRDAARARPVPADRPARDRCGAPVDIGRAGAGSQRGRGARVNAGAIGDWAVLLAVLGGAIRGSTPFLFVSLGGVPDPRRAAASISARRAS